MGTNLRPRTIIDHDGRLSNRWALFEHSSVARSGARVGHMLTNRSAPHARIVPVLTVRDVRAAVAWYGEVLGFVEHVRIGEGHRAQLGLPGGAAELIVAEVRP